MWDKIANKYHIWAEINSWYYRIFANEILKISKPKLVLDICSGPGVLGRELRKILDAQVVNIDSSIEMCRISRGILGDALNLPFKNEVFDLVIFCFALHELDAERAIKEAGRVLKKGGAIAIADLNPKIPDSVKILSSALLSIIFGNEYAENLLKKWKDLKSVEEIGNIIEREGFKIEHVTKRVDFWIIAKKI
ncbi:MAG: methyltransferase domain-containing protein [Archaeoglobales archaeon]|nr:methyltransferase domain-containing protein [Archaeoglobales archaeon]